jgi:hypothetical protein
LELVLRGWFYGTACCLAVLLFYPMLPRQVSFAVFVVMMTPIFLFGAFCSISFILGLIVPLVALIFEGKRKAEYEWRRWWWWGR